MNASRFASLGRVTVCFVTVCIALLLASAALLTSVALLTSTATAQDDKPQPARFGNLLAVGDGVYLQSTSDNPLYSVQLLSQEQVAAIEQENAEIARLQKQAADVHQKLTMEQRLEQRATMLLEVDRLELEIGGRTRRLSVSGEFYAVSRVGEDFLALKNDMRETFVPFSSIRSMYQGEPPAAIRSSTIAREQYARSLAAGGFSGRTGRPSGFDSGGFPSGGFGDSRWRSGEFTAQLQYVKAAPLAEVIKKLFAEGGVDVTIEETSNSLIIRADVEQASTIGRLIARLDTNPEE
jgi:hypothetical protein